jgi:hypothetical protein
MSYASMKTEVAELKRRRDDLRRKYGDAEIAALIRRRDDLQRRYGVAGRSARRPTTQAEVRAMLTQNRTILSGLLAKAEQSGNPKAIAFFRHELRNTEAGLRGEPVHPIMEQSMAGRVEIVRR